MGSQPHPIAQASSKPAGPEEASHPGASGGAGGPKVAMIIVGLLLKLFRGSYEPLPDTPSGQFIVYANYVFLGLPLLALDGIPPTSGEWCCLKHVQGGYKHLGAALKPFNSSYEHLGPTYSLSKVAISMWGQPEAFQW